MLFENEITGEIKPAIDDITINDEVYELVDRFYPRRNFVQVLQLIMEPEDIMNFMDCNYDDAHKLYFEIRAYFEDREMRVLIPHFCHYMGIDELWVHLFIASLKKYIPLPRRKSKPDPAVDNPFPGEERIKLAQAIENLKLGKMDSLEIRRERARQWKLLNTRGEVRYKRFDNFRVVIYTDEIAAILRIHLRTAQAMIREIRSEYDIPKNAPISIKKFCFHFKYEEEEIRMALARMYGEKYIAP
ncbi:hypothetical protein A4D02_32890 [Niastella koreensis]|uniref:Uncharacterized protein n=2 Tax=Niastella koreensis TaxID=354356 RepID=G8T8P5_NIAKG|nr:hypothetical protein [Niastella koreensis]AEW01225.1 hypothetical protein Niako_4985 [Niastella koreensis GR20-10]OQP45990.1 hypothetical protein A4D02_32890 [Niastella koreensis]